MNKTYEPKSFESRIYASDMQKGYFHADAKSDKTSFTVMLPPPNITGQLHMGHALDQTFQDAIIRYKRMKGFEALWLPGVDHASIATEVKIVEKLKEEGTSKAELGREAFLERAYQWKEQYGGRIVEQMKQLGVSCDWDRMAFTMDERCSKAVKTVFVNLYNKGLIYKGDRIINWCPCCKTAISDAEVEYEQAHSHLWHIRYDLEDGTGSVTVATTRPETMLGDTAVAVHPSDKRYASFVGKNLILPLVGRKIPVVADPYVEKEFGTGAVKITPAHDPNDFEVGARHELPIIRVMDDAGVMNENAGAYCGLDRAAAREKIVADLKACGALVKIEDHLNNVGHCYRCHTVIEPIVSKQWFVKMKPLAAPAIQAVKTKKVTFSPKRFEKTYLHWMENIRDWCISRQLWWGHRIPVYYCDACGEMTASIDPVDRCPHCGGAARQDEDVLDTWFSSALWPFSTLGWPENTEDLKKFYPTNVLVTAYDIITFWVSRMIFSGIEHMSEVPFSEVLIHGIVRDEQGRKMSKSLGNGVDPLEIIESYSADTLRFSLVHGIAAGGDIKYSTKKLDGYSNFMNKIWNAARFVLLNCEGVAVKPLSDVKLSLADKWILHGLNDTVSAVTKYMDKYEVGLAAAKLYDFTWSEFCDWYIELNKTELYGADEATRADRVSVLVHVLREILKMLHPITPFITSEIYDALPNKDAENIVIAPYPAPVKRPLKRFAEDMRAVMEVIRSVRALRTEMNVPQNKRTALFIKPATDKTALVKKTARYIEKLANGSSLTVVEKKPDGNMAALVTPVCEVYIPMGELVDTAAERKRLEKELATVESEIARAQGKLNNTGFTAKAPAKLIDEEKAKLKKYTDLKESILAKIADLK